MNPHDELHDHLMLEIRYQIPVQALAMIGSIEGISTLVTKHLTHCRERTDANIEQLFWHAVRKYVTNKVKQDIFDLHDQAKPPKILNGPIRELVEEYRDCGQLAEEALAYLDKVWALNHRPRIYHGTEHRNDGTLLA